MAEETETAQQSPSSFPIRMDHKAHHVWRDGKIITPRLTPEEFAVLSFLIQNAGEELGAEKIYRGSGLSRIQGISRSKKSERSRIKNTIGAKISYIRKKLGLPNIIVGLAGGNYMLSPDGTEVPVRISKHGFVQRRNIKSLTPD